MKNQAIFFSKHKSKKLKCCLLQFLFGALMVNIVNVTTIKEEKNKSRFSSSERYCCCCVVVLHLR